MKIKELIEKLKQFDENDLVMARWYEWGYEDAKEPEEFDMLLNVNTSCYYWPHEKDEEWRKDDDGYKDYKRAKAVII